MCRDDFDAQNRLREVRREVELYRLARLTQDGAKARPSFLFRARFWLLRLWFNSQRSSPHLESAAQRDGQMKPLS